MDEEAIRRDERQKIAQEIRDEAHALARAGRNVEGGVPQPSSFIAPSTALAVADWIEQRFH